MPEAERKASLAGLDAGAVKIRAEAMGFRLQRTIRETDTCYQGVSRVRLTRRAYPELLGG